MDKNFPHIKFIPEYSDVSEYSDVTGTDDLKEETSSRGMCKL